jgi:hypothetical protein
MIGDLPNSHGEMDTCDFHMNPPILQEIHRHFRQSFLLF